MSIFDFINSSGIEEKTNLKILEIGPGTKPLFNKPPLQKHQIFAIDKIKDSERLNNITFIHGDFLSSQFDIKFDYIFDRLTLHEQNINERELYLNKIKHLLSENGEYICEHGIYHNQMEFDEEDLLYNNNTHLLYQQKDEVIKIVKYIPPAFEIEKQLLNKGFKIIEFLCDSSKKIICNRKSDIPKISDPDHLYFRVKKN